MNHSGDSNKMVSDTPRTDEAVWHTEGGEIILPKFCRQLERELNRSNEMYRKLNLHALNLVDSIKRLEEAGDGLFKTMLTPERVEYSTWACLQADARNAWRKAKEAKP